MLKAEKQHSLMSGISSALVMDGSAYQIEKSARDAIKLLGRDGGYFCTVD
jgi:hypothetical protein